MAQTEHEFLLELEHITQRATRSAARDEKHRAECNGWRYWVAEDIKRATGAKSHAVLAGWVAC
jgi:hypothetical protein